MSIYHRQTLPESWNTVTDRCKVVLFPPSLSGYALQNTPRTAANNLDAKHCPIMNTRSASEYSMFAPAWLLCNLRAQRPSNKGDLDWSVMGEILTVCYTCVDLFLTSFLYHSALLGFVLTLYLMPTQEMKAKIILLLLFTGFSLRSRVKASETMNEIFTELLNTCHAP
jgi:hypothetical protein